MKNILVTGGTGFIGSHTCVCLLENDYFVTVIDSLINSKKNVINNIKKINPVEPDIFDKRFNFFRGDIRDEKLLNEIFQFYKINNNPISAVIHFAGLKSVKESMQNPIKYSEFNVGGSKSLFNVMKRHKCKNIVFSSSAMVYKGGNIPLNENSELKPNNPYGENKLEIENILYKYFLSDCTDWKIINLRYFNPIGAHYSGLIGENPNAKENNLFPVINDVALGGKDFLTIYGNDWPTHDGTCLRDYIHVMDLADGHIAALEHLEHNKSQILNMNLGTGKGTSVLELINIFEQVNNVKIDYEFTKRRKGDNAIVIADNSKADSLLNWQPKRSIYEMCKDGWNWQLKNIDGY